MDWIIPCNVRDYDVISAFSNLNVIDWRQSAKNINEGDFVYIYCGKPMQKILFKTQVIKTNIPYSEVDKSDEQFNITDSLNNDSDSKKYMRLKLIKYFSHENFSLKNLMENGLTKAPQGPMKIKPQLHNYLNYSFTDNCINSEAAYLIPINDSFNNISYIEFWTKFKNYIEEYGENLDILPLYKPSNHNWYDVNFGINNYHIVLRVSKQKNTAQIDFYIKEDKSIFDDLFLNKSYLEQKTNIIYDWKRKIDRKASIISTEISLDKFDTYSDCYKWYYSNMEKIFYEFHSIIDNSQNIYPESEGTETCIEGAKTTVQVNKYERSSIARQKCIDANGCYCHVCGLNFEEYYGEVGKNFIHVHHKIPLNKINKEYIVDPVNDLIPICPNCHAMLHRKVKGKYLSIDELKAILHK